MGGRGGSSARGGGGGAVGGTAFQKAMEIGEQIKDDRKESLYILDSSTGEILAENKGEGDRVNAAASAAYGKDNINIHNHPGARIVRGRLTGLSMVAPSTGDLDSYAKADVGQAIIVGETMGIRIRKTRSDADWNGLVRHSKRVGSEGFNHAYSTSRQKFVDANPSRFRSQDEALSWARRLQKTVSTDLANYYKRVGKDYGFSVDYWSY